MPGKLSRHVRSNIIGYLALLVALSGTAWAATELSKNEVKSRHIKNGGVKTKDLGGNAVTSPKVANKSLLSEDFAPGQLPAGERGEPGEMGPPGPPGEPGSARAFAKVTVLGDGSIAVSQTKGLSADNFVKDPSAMAVCVRNLPFEPQNIVGSAQPAGGPQILLLTQIPPETACTTVVGAQAVFWFQPSTVSAFTPSSGTGQVLIN